MGLSSQSPGAPHRSEPGCLPGHSAVSEPAGEAGREQITFSRVTFRLKTTSPPAEGGVPGVFTAVGLARGGRALLGSCSCLA